MLETLERVLRQIGKNKPDLLRLPWSRKELLKYRFSYLVSFSQGESAYLINIDNTNVGLCRSWMKTSLTSFYCFLFQKPMIELHHGKRPPLLSPSLNLQDVSDQLQLIRTFHLKMKSRLDALAENIENNEQWETLFPSTVRPLTFYPPSVSEWLSCQDSDGTLANAVDAYKAYCEAYPSILWLLDGWKRLGRQASVKGLLYNAHSLMLREGWREKSSKDPAVSQRASG